MQLRALPATEHTGIVFYRTDITAHIPVSPALVQQTPLCTRLQSPQGHVVQTIEHLMAALHTSGITNARFELNSDELPILDGSSLPFMQAIEQAGTQEQQAEINPLTVKQEIQLADGERSAVIKPAERLVLEVTVDYGHPHLGRQHKVLEITPESFLRELAPARTFCFERDVAHMQANGLALGGSLDNAVVIGEQGIVNPTPLRFADEAVRHKMLDAVGDFYLAARPVQAHIILHAPGHAFNAQVLKTIMQNAA